MPHQGSGHHVSFHCHHHSHASTLHPNHMFLCLCFSVYPSPSSIPFFLKLYLFIIIPPASIYNCCSTHLPPIYTIPHPLCVSSFNYIYVLACHASATAALPLCCHSHNISHGLFLYTRLWKETLLINLTLPQFEQWTKYTHETTLD